MTWQKVLWWTTLLLAAWQGGLGWIDVFTESRAYVHAREGDVSLSVGSYFGEPVYEAPRSGMAAWIADEHQTRILECDGNGSYRLVQIVGEDDGIATQLWPWIRVTSETDPGRGR